MNVSEGFSKSSISEEELSKISILDMIGIMQEGILIVSENMQIIAINDAAKNIFGKEGKDFINRRLTELVRDITIHDTFQKLFAENQVQQTKVEIQNKTKQTFDLRVTPLFLSNSRHAIGFFYDTTKIDHLENVRQEFLSNISHELRTPLTSIIAFVETLENGGLEDSSNNLRFLKIIKRNSERMRLLISDISELSLIEAGKVVIEPQNLKLSELIDEIFASLSSKASERKIKLENKVPKDAIFFADRVRLEQILVNLIDNAIKFNRENGSVKVIFECDESSNFLSVSDKGEGVLPEQKTRIFERLYRGDRARTSKIGGTGLGLAIVKHLIRLHNGDIELKSKLGKGSTFTIKFPKKSKLFSC